MPYSMLCPYPVPASSRSIHTLLTPPAAHHYHSLQWHLYTLSHFLQTSQPCGTTNINPETDIRVQAEGQKSKAANHIESSYLCEIFRLLRERVLSRPALHSSLVLGLKACTSTTQPLWITSVAAGIKVCATAAWSIWQSIVSSLALCIFGQALFIETQIEYPIQPHKSKLICCFLAPTPAPRL